MATSAVVGSLRVNLGLDSAQFQAGLQNAAGRLRVARTQFLAFGAAAAAALTGVFMAARAGADDISATVDASRRLGASIGAYEALRLAADDAGVSIESITDDFQNLNRELSRAAEGGKAADALQRLGMSAADFDGLDMDAKVALLSDRIVSLGLDTGTTTQLLRDLGIRNREMVLLMMAGGDAIRSARQDVQDYGLALNAVDADRVESATDQISRLGVISRYVGQQLAVQLIPPLGALSQALTDSLRPGGMLRTVLDGLIGNLQRLGTYAATFAAFLGARYVAAFVAARAATITLAGAMTFLRGALIRTGIGALIVGAGELVYWFSKLVGAAGGFGTAMGLLKDVATEVWFKIQMSGLGMIQRLQARWADLSAVAIDVLADMMDSVAWFGNRAIGVFRGAFSAIRAVWALLPEALGDLTYQAAEAVINGVIAMVNGAIDQISSGIRLMVDAMGPAMNLMGGAGIALRAMASIGDVEIPHMIMTNQFAGAATDAGAAAAEGWREGFNSETFDVSGIVGDLRALANDRRVSAASHDAAANLAHEFAGGGMTTLQPLLDLMGQVSAESPETAESLDNISEAIDGGGGGSGGIAGAAQNAATELTAMQQAAKRGADTIADAFGALIDKSKSWKDVLVDILTKIRDFQLEKAFQSLASANGGNNIFGWLGSLMGANADGTRNFGGGWTRIHERGGEIANLPSGTQIIPHDISKRMADRSAVQQTAQVEIIPSPYFDARVDGRAARVTGAGMQMQSKATRSTFMSQNERYG